MSRNRFEEFQHLSPSRPERASPSRWNPFAQDQEPVQAVELGGMHHPASSLEQFFAEIQEIKAKVEEVDHRIDQLEQLQQRVLHAVQLVDMHRLRGEAEDDATALNLLTSTLQLRLKRLAPPRQPPKEDPHWQIRKTQHALVMEKFVALVKRYCAVQQVYREKQQERARRQLLIINPAATEEEVETVLSSSPGENATPIFVASIMQDVAKAEAQTALDEAQDRHDALHRLERSIMELQKIFGDMQLLVEQQGEQVDRIEEYVLSTEDFTAKANTELITAVRMQKAARRRWWWITMLTLILLGTLAAVLWFVVIKPRL